MTDGDGRSTVAVADKVRQVKQVKSMTDGLLVGAGLV